MTRTLLPMRALAGSNQAFACPVPPPYLKALEAKQQTVNALWKTLSAAGGCRGCGRSSQPAGLTFPVAGRY